MKKNKKECREDSLKFQERISMIELLGRLIEDTGGGTLYPTDVGPLTEIENEVLKRMMRKNPELLTKLRRGGDV